MKKKIRKIVVTTLLFVLTIGLALGAGTYRNIVSAEKAQFRATIPSKNNSPIVLDLAKQSFPKKLVQPGLVSISTGHGPMGIQNTSNKDLVVQISLKGFPGKVELEVPGVEYDEKTFIFTQPLKPKQQFGMALSFEVPKEFRNKLVGFSGEIQFLNHKDKTLLSSIPVHIVNSKYGNPYKKLNIEPTSFGNGSWGGKGKSEGKGKPESTVNENKKGDGNDNSTEKNKEKEICH